VKQRIYRAIKNSHIHGSPDGPWFFIIARTESQTRNLQLIGITDTSMLRPQVFAYLDAEGVKVGAISSEKQAIDAFLEGLALDYPEVSPVADKYWNARGGSHSDGGAFIYTLEDTIRGKNMRVEDKFGKRLFSEKAAKLNLTKEDFDGWSTPELRDYSRLFNDYFKRRDLLSSGYEAMELLRNMTHQELIDFISQLIFLGEEKDCILDVVDLLTFLHDRRYLTVNLKRGFLIGELDKGIKKSLDLIPEFTDSGYHRERRIGWEDREGLRESSGKEEVLVINCKEFPPDGIYCVASFVVKAYKLGWKRFILYNCNGDRFIGSGLGPGSEGVRIDVYGSSGDYLGSGVDGAHIYVHGNAQDQVGQILKSGKIVIYGDVGQTFFYGAKGGVGYVLGNAAGRPLINAVGSVRAIINGTCLDYCAESFMAGKAVGGGFVIINGVEFDERGEVIGLESKYPGSNFFSLASGGAGYVSDPYYTMGEEQLNGGEFVDFTHEDWLVIHPYLVENERLFGIQIRRDLLTVDGVIMWPKEVFRKVVASEKQEELDWSSLPE